MSLKHANFILGSNHFLVSVWQFISREGRSSHYASWLILLVMDMPESTFWECGAPRLLSKIKHADCSFSSPNDKDAHILKVASYVLCNGDILYWWLRRAALRCQVCQRHILLLLDVLQKRLLLCDVGTAPGLAFELQSDVFTERPFQLQSDSILARMLTIELTEASQVIIV